MEGGGGGGWYEFNGHGTEDGRQASPEPLGEFCYWV